jgi:D-glycero-alpha-D-manno-heptose-7-phosphate kinase
MKIVRAPLRITLGGGGTDLPGWYREHGGFLVAAAVDKFIYVTGSRRSYDEKIWLSYSKVEVCDQVADIQHELFKACLAKFTVPLGFEMHSISELPGNTGLGSSGAFLVAVIKLLCEVERRALSTHEIADLACRIEMEELGRSSGKQDPYVAAFGGVITMTMDKKGHVEVEPLALSNRTLRDLNNNIRLYHTGITRQSEEVLKFQNRDLGGKVKSAVEAMTRIQEIGYESRDCLLKGDADGFGHLLHEHWLEKKSMSGNMSAPSIDALYDYAMAHGALGGKVVGAGGGGFLMVYVPTPKLVDFDEAMTRLGSREMEWRFCDTGVSAVYSL